MTAAPRTVGREQSLRAARHIMHANAVRHLPVLHAGELVGLLSEREVEVLATLPGSDLFTVEEAMVPDAYLVEANAPLDQVASEMARRKLGSAVVRDGAEVVGVFTAVDALRALADALKPAAASP
jgi:acetoin utilization protein AcuB